MQIFEVMANKFNIEFVLNKEVIPKIKIKV
jgi:hypothetical protein